MNRDRLRNRDRAQEIISRLEAACGDEKACEVFERAIASAVRKYRSGDGEEALFGLLAEELEKSPEYALTGRKQGA